MVPLRLTRRPGRARTRVRTLPRHGELIAGMDVAEASTPTDEVVGEHGAGQPGGVGEEVPRGAVLEARPLFEISDGELDVGMGTVEGVGATVSSVDVGDKGVVPPVGPQGGLRSGQPGAAHDEHASALGVGRLGHLGLAVLGVGDWTQPPRRSRRWARHLGVGAHRHREGDAQAPHGGHGLLRPEPRVHPQDDLAGGTGPAQTGDELLYEALGPARVGEPFRIREWSTSPVSHRVAIRGWRPRTLVYP